MSKSNGELDICYLCSRCPKVETGGLESPVNLEGVGGRANCTRKRLGEKKMGFQRSRV